MLKSFKQHIASDIATRIGRDEIVLVDQYTLRVMADRAAISGPDAEFHRVGTQIWVRGLVKECVGKYSDSKPKKGALMLPGFEHLQVAYSVKRGDDIALVPVHMLTGDELEARAVDLDGMAKGCQDHAREIRAYIAMREASNDNHATRLEAVA